MLWQNVYLNIASVSTWHVGIPEDQDLTLSTSIIFGTL
jgi:hypothetical protein